MTCIKTFKPAGFLCAFLVALHLIFAARAENATGGESARGRLVPIVDFTLQKGTNKPISVATAKALGFSEEMLPATQAAFLLPGETQVHAFGVSSRNTNDLFVALIDKDTRSGKVWLTSPTGEIRVTILTSSNSPPQVVPNE